jgi:hypothetical protein
MPRAIYPWAWSVVRLRHTHKAIVPGHVQVFLINKKIGKIHNEFHYYHECSNDANIVWHMIIFILPMALATFVNDTMPIGNREMIFDSWGLLITPSTART